MSVTYDGRYSDLCKDACQDGVCTKDIGEPYGCGSCCGCLGGCRLGWEEQVAEQAGVSGVADGEDHQ